MTKLKRICITAILTALYFVFSCTLKIPFIGHIALDLGYVVLICTAVCYGGITAAIVGSLGCALESILLSSLGFSISWCVMNFVVGLIVGLICYRLKGNYRYFAIPVIIVAVAIGILLKTGIECYLYQIPFMVKLPKAVTAFAIDSSVMIIGLPLSYFLKLKFNN